MRRFEDLIAEHDVAIHEFVNCASCVPGERWDTPRAAGKWTPAQEVKHVVLGLEAFGRDLRGEGKLRLKGKWWQRRLWRLFAFPRIMRTRSIFRAVPAPRETRPPDNPGDQATLLAELQEQWGDLRALAIETYSASPRRSVTHPYFGDLTVAELVGFSVIHVRHHARFLTWGSDVAAPS